MTHLIDKDALIAEIEDRIKNLNERLIKHPISSPTLEKLIEENKKVLLLINTLEVKEVDLENEINKELETRWRGEYLFTSKFRESAKHFFELGLKAQKGE